MTKLAETKILNKLNRIEKMLVHLVPQISEDDWLNDSVVVKELEERADNAEKDFKDGKLQTVEEVFAELKA